MKAKLATVLTIVALLAAAAPALGQWSGWEVTTDREIIAPYAASGDVALGTETGALRSAYAIVSVPPGAEGYVRVYFFDRLAADCTVTVGTALCSTAVIPLWANEPPPDLEGFRSLNVRVESNTEYTLTVRGALAGPAPFVAFLPQIGR